MRSIVEVKDNWISLDSLEKAKEQVERNPVTIPSLSTPWGLLLFSITTI